VAAGHAVASRAGGIGHIAARSLGGTSQGMSHHRRLIAALVVVSATLLLLFSSSRAGGLLQLVLSYSSPAATSPVVDPFLIDLEQRTFHFFWDTANPRNGLVPDRFPSPSYSSVAAVGFALTAYPVGVERGYVTRKEARKRVLTTLRFFRDAPQGHSPTGMTGYKGFYYHFLDMKTGQRFEDSELSTVDTALFLAGALFCQSYFDRDDPEEAQIRRIVDELYRRVDWQWAQPHAPAISLGWSPEEGFLEYDWRGYNEAMLVYLLALGSPSHPAGPEAWAEWTSTYDAGSWGTVFGQEFLNFAPLFGHQYTHVWIDFRKLQDAYMRRRGIDYFENTRRAVYAQRAYAIANPRGCKHYGATVWGLTASDGPADTKIGHGPTARAYKTYAARGADAYDDCTLAPTAVVGSLPFAPELAIPAVLDMHKRFGQYIYSKYGFLDAFNLSFDATVPVTQGRCIPGFGWVDDDYLGIDQGAILAMIENYRSSMIWDVMRKNRYIRDGLARAGFDGGWLTASSQ
jgi:hypothetical protein